jgi:hypothetical protein
MPKIRLHSASPTRPPQVQPAAAEHRVSTYAVFPTDRSHHTRSRALTSARAAQPWRGTSRRLLEASTASSRPAITRQPPPRRLRAPSSPDTGVATGAAWGKVSAVLFDMDGVLCNSEEPSRQAAVDVFAEMGVDVTVDDFVPFMGTGNRLVWRPYCQ